MLTFSQVYKPYARGEGVTPDVSFYYIIHVDIQSFLSVFKASL